MEEAENLIRKVLAELDSPSMGGTTCTPGLLLERTKSCLDAIDNSTANFSLYNNDSSGKCVQYALHCLLKATVYGTCCLFFISSTFTSDIK